MAPTTLALCCDRCKEMDESGCISYCDNCRTRYFICNDCTYMRPGYANREIYISEGRRGIFNRGLCGVKTIGHHCGLTFNGTVMY